MVPIIAYSIISSRKKDVKKKVWAKHIFLSFGRLAQATRDPHPSDPPAVLGYFDTEAFYLGPAIEIESLVHQFAAKLDGSSQDARSARIIMWPTQVRVGTIIWRTLGKTPRDSISRQDAIAVLGRAGLTQPDGEAILREAVKAGFFQETNNKLTLPTLYRRCFNLFWSGHLFEIECTPLMGTRLEDLVNTSKKAKRLLFVGPLGQAALCETLSPQHDGGNVLTVPGGTQTASLPERRLAITYLPNNALE